MRTIHHCCRILMRGVGDVVKIRYPYHGFHVLGNLNRYLFFSLCCIRCLRIIRFNRSADVDGSCWYWLVIEIIVNIGVNSNYILQF